MKKNKPAGAKETPKKSRGAEETARKAPKLKPAPKAKNWKKSIFEEEDDGLFDDDAGLDLEQDDVQDLDGDDDDDDRY